MKTEKEAYARYNIELAWDEFEKSGEISNYAESVLQSADFFKSSHDSLVEEVDRLRSDRNGAVAQMSKSWQHNHESQSDLLTRYTEMADRQFKELDRLRNENERLTAIATNHATRADELYDALDGLLEVLDSEWTHSRQVHNKIDEAREVLDKSRIEAEGK